MKTFVRVLLTLLVLFALAVIGLAFPLDLAIALTAGWAFFLVRVWPEVTIDPAGVATAVLCLGLLLVGTHALLRQLAGGTAREGTPARPWRFRWTASIIGAVVLMFVAGISATGVVHQAGWLMTSEGPIIQSTSSTAARRAQSTNNLKTIGLGLDNYQRSHSAYPPGATFDDRGRPLHGWQAALLPYVEYQELHDRIDFDRPWSDPSNRDVYRTSLLVYLNPGVPDRVDDRGYALGHYAGNALMLGGDRARRLADVTDGTSHTILAGEVASGFGPWGHPVNWRDPALGINRSPDGFGSPFPGGANVLFADGSVQFIRDVIDPQVLGAMGTPDGGEEIPIDPYRP